MLVIVSIILLIIGLFSTKINISGQAPPLPVVQQAAVQYGYPTIVLNKHAAFVIFGTTEAAGKNFIFEDIPYLVIGVFDDGDMENLNIYILSAPHYVPLSHDILKLSAQASPKFLYTLYA